MPMGTMPPAISALRPNMSPVLHPIFTPTAQMTKVTGEVPESQN